MSVIGNWYFKLLLFCSTFCAQDLASDQNEISSNSFTTTNEPLLLDDSFSSVVINETNALSDIDCALRCLSKQSNGCVAVVSVMMTNICQLVYINNESLLDDPLGYGHVTRFLGSQPGAKVWKVPDFDNILLTSSIRRTTFRNTSTGRIGSIQKINVKYSGCYSIEVAGAKGGDTANNKSGGSGSLIKGNFNLSVGIQLSIVVGQSGGQGSTKSPTNGGGGGGGGSFVYTTADSQLLIAAGGGGGASEYYHGKPGESGVNGTGSLGRTNNYGFGGINGQPGSNDPNATASNHGGCGAGWLGKPVNPRKTNSSGDRGGSLADGWVGGLGGTGTTADGGFGGGGGGGSPSGAAGAGGGFSGGGAGMTDSHCGGGGDSYCSGFGCNATSGGNTGSDNGYVTLQLRRASCN